MRPFLALLLALPLTVAASAQEPIDRCAPHDTMSETLLTNAKEHPVGIGISEDRSLMEVYASEWGTWTIVSTDMVSGMSCIRSFGENFHMRPIPKKEQGA